MPDRRIIALGLVAALAALGGCAGGPRHPAADPASIRRAHRQGVEFLLRDQNADGSWGTFESSRPGEIYLGTVSSFNAFHQATSALCCMALAQPSREIPAAKAALDRGLHFLLTVEPSNRATGDTFYDNWTHLYVLQALSVFLQDERFAVMHKELRRVAERELGTLARLQSADGGFGYYDFGWALKRPMGMESTSFMTSAALMALDEAKRAGLTVPDPMIRSGLASLSGLRLGDGAFIYSHYAALRPGVLFNRVNGSLGRSQPCNLAMWTFHHKDLKNSDLVRGLDNLFTQHAFIEMGRGRPYPHEAWYYTAGYYFFFGHYYAARVIEQLEPAERPAWRSKLASTLVRLQDPDGSWFDFPLYGYYKEYGTAFALMSLQYGLPMPEVTASEAPKNEDDPAAPPPVRRPGG